MFYTWRWVARCATYNPHRTVVPWQCVLGEIQTLRRALQGPTAISIGRHRSTDDTPMLVNDASKTGPFAAWGSIFVKGGRASASWGQFDIADALGSHINELELRAIYNGLRANMDSLSPSSVLRVACDNQVAAHVLRRGRSSSLRLHRWVVAIKNLARSLDLTLVIAWLPSHLNPSDALSRALGPAPVDFAAAIDLATMPWGLAKEGFDSHTSLFVLRSRNVFG